MITLASILAFLAYSIVLLFFFWIFLGLVRACVKLFFPSKAFSDLSPQSIAISLGITAFIFSNTVNVSIQLFFNLLINGLSIFVRSIGEITRDGLNDQEDLFRNIAESLMHESEELSTYLHKFINGTPFSSIIVAMSTWLVIALALNNKPLPNPMAYISRWYSGLSKNNRRKLITSFVLVLGGYLSLASIIAISWIQSSTTNNPALINEQRTKFISSISSNKLIEDQRNSEINTDIEVLEKTRQLLTNLKVTEEKQEHLDLLKNYLEIIEHNIDKLQSTWSNLREEAIMNNSKLSSLAIKTYDSYSNTDLSKREIEVFQDDLLEWHEHSLTLVNNKLIGYKQYARHKINSWNHWARKIFNDIEDFKNLDKKVRVNEPTKIRDLGELLISSGRLESSPPPPIPREIIGLGVFGYFANWLVEIRSFSLALISGMIGFGLFGSVMSRALVSYEPEIEKEVDRAGLDVFLVGLSAAVIIFLASQGGLAIMSSGEPTPNPYILFLACFVGAAYGDKVWNTAKIRLGRSLKTQEDNPNSEEKS